MKKVLLVHPPGYFQFPPLGLLKLAALRRSKGDSIELIMPKFEITKTEKLKRPSIKEQKKDLRYRLSTIDYEPDLVYVTSLFTWEWPNVHETIGLIKRVTKNPVYLGGIYATLMPEHAKKSGATVKPGLVENAEDLMPAYDLVPKWNASMGFSSRGCTNNCKFCAVPKLESQYYAEKSIEHFLYPGHKGVILFDNNFLASPYWNEILTEIRERKIWVDFNQGLDFRLLDNEKAKGLLSIRRFRGWFRTALDHVDNIGPIEDAVNLLQKQGFTTIKNIQAFMLYNFTDSPDDFLERLKFGLKLGITLYPMKYQPVKGPSALEKGKFISSNWTKEQLDLVAMAQRTVGNFGSFIPTREWFNKQVANANTLEDALTVTPVGRNPKQMKGQTLLSEFGA